MCQERRAPRYCKTAGNIWTCFVSACRDDAVAVPEEIEVEEDLGPVEDEDVQQITVALEDEQFFEIEVNRPDDTGNASSIEAVIVVQKRQKKEYSRS